MFFLVRWDFLVACGVEFRATNQQQQITFVTKACAASRPAMLDLAKIDASMPRFRTTTAMAIFSRGEPLSVDDNRQCRLTMMVRDSFSATAMLTARW